MRQVRAPVDNETLKWAREMAGFSENDAVEKIDYLKNKRKKGEDAVAILREWEKGIMKPLLNPARQMAKSYDRSLSFLYLPLEVARENENDEPLKLKDFRRKSATRLTPNTIKFLREVKRKQRWASSWFKDNDFPKSDLVSKFPNFPDEGNINYEEECVKYILNRFYGNKKHKLTFKNWVSQIEEVSEIIIMQSKFHHHTYKVGNEFSGCAMKDDYAPVIALNYNEKEERKLFTLIHELAHLLIGEEGVSKIEFRTDNNQQDKTEAYCNRIAAQVLMPKEEFKLEWKNKNEDIEKVAKFFHVSLSATVIRAHHLKLLSEEETNSKIKFFKEAREKNEKRKKSGDKNRGFPAPRPDLDAIERAGGKLTKKILEAYNGDEVTSLEVSRLFNVKLQYLEKIAEKTKIPLDRWSSNSEPR